MDAREQRAQLRLLTIHEAVPGHYLQLAYANRTDSTVRAIFGSGVFAEGWAVYVTQVMMDVGYGAEDPALMLVHLKFYLRSITNTLMDLRIHAGSMDQAEAMELMVEGGFQEEGEATNKWDRAACRRPSCASTSSAALACTTWRPMRAARPSATRSSSTAPSWSRCLPTARRRCR